MQKFSFFLISTLTAVLLYFGLDRITTLDEEESAANAGELLSYDAISEGINTVLHDETGAVSYTVQATRQYHFKDQSSELQAPFIRLFREGKSHWNIVAEKGILSPESGSQNLEEGLIELSGNVEIYSLDEFGNRIVLSTEFLTIDPTAETMQTDLPVAMQTPNVQQNAIGMFAYLNSDEIHFNSNSTGQYAIQSIP